MKRKVASAYKFTWKEKIAVLRPGFLITGSFIGLGTVTSSTRADATCGFQLFRCVVFSVIAVTVVQGMSTRLSIITQEGLAENLKNDFTGRPLLRNLLCGLVAPAIAIGGSAYIGGGLTGIALDVGALTGISTEIIASVWGLYILLILNFAGDAVKYLEKLLGICIIIMAIVLVMTMVIVRPDLGTVSAGCVPSIPENDGLTTYLSLIGATVVPYNMFLRTVSAKRIWHSAEEPPLCNFSTMLPIIVDDIVTDSIMVTSAVVMHSMIVNSAMDMAIQLGPTFGALARPFMAIGLIATGASSVIYTPMGVSYVLAGLFGWKTDSSDKCYTFTDAVVLITGIVIAALGTSPLGLIIMAQVVNGIVLPVVVGVTVYLICHEKTMGQCKDNMLQTVSGTTVFIISLILGVSGFLGVFS